MHGGMLHPLSRLLKLLKSSLQRREEKDDTICREEITAKNHICQKLGCKWIPLRRGTRGCCTTLSFTQWYLWSSPFLRSTSYYNVFGIELHPSCGIGFVISGVSCQNRRGWFEFYAGSDFEAPVIRVRQSRKHTN